MTIPFSLFKDKLARFIDGLLFNPWLFLLTSGLLWRLSLEQFDIRKMEDWGFASLFPSLIVVAYVLLLAGFASLYFRKDAPDVIFAAYVLLLIFMLHGTPYFVFDTMRYSWAWKHVGIVDYIMRHGAVNPQVAILPVYHNWPGFFAFNALLTQLSGFASADMYAGWAPVFFEIFFALGILSLFRLFTSDRHLQWLGVWFFLLTNWVGQDYFSPQAMTYFMLFGVLFLILYGFPSSQMLSGDFLSKNLSRFAGALRLPSRWVAFLARLRIPLLLHDPAIASQPAAALGVIILIIFGAIVSSHQLTPFMGFTAALLFILFRFSRWRALPLWMLAMILLWLAFPARSYEREVIASTIESFGNVQQTVSSSLVDVTKISSGQVVVSWMGRGLSAFIGLLAGFGVFQRMRKGKIDFLVILLMAAPMIVLFLNDYGGEALFRVYFFCLPYFSFLAACAVLPDRKSLRDFFPSALVVFCLSAVMLLAFLFAYNGKDRQYCFTKAELEAARYLYRHALPDSLLVEGSRNYPAQFLHYDFFTYTPIDREDSHDAIVADPVSVLSEWLSNSSRYRHSYFLITRSQIIYTEEVGVMPSGALVKMRDELSKSDMFEIVFSNEDAVIFAMKEK